MINLYSLTETCTNWDVSYYHSWMSSHRWCFSDVALADISLKQCSTIGSMQSWKSLASSRFVMSRRWNILSFALLIGTIWQYDTLSTTIQTESCILCQNNPHTHTPVPALMDNSIRVCQRNWAISHCCKVGISSQDGNVIPPTKREPHDSHDIYFEIFWVLYPLDSSGNPT